MPGSRQQRRPSGQHGKVSGAGVGVDQYGGPAIDPTENVLALVDAESKYQNHMREAEIRRINDLAALRVQYETVIESMRTAALTTASTLLATALKETKMDLSDRTSKLEQFRWESGGKSTARGDVWAYIIGAAGIGAAIAMYFK